MNVFNHGSEDCRWRLPLGVCLGLLGLACVPSPTRTELSKVEDPLAFTSPAMGTGGFAYNHGAAFVGACAPHGLIKAGPDTTGRYGDLRFIHYSGYWAGDDIIRGFSQLHMHGTGATDYGAIVVQPVTDASVSPIDPSGYASPFDKKTEVLGAGTYAVTLKKWNTRVELAASPHVAHYRLTFPQGSTPAVVLDLSRALADGRMKDQQLTQVDDHTLRGSVRLLGGFSKGFGGNLIFFELRSQQALTVTQQDAASRSAVLTFTGSERVELQLGLSLVSAAGATANLAAEAPTFDFEGLTQKTQQAWRERLGRFVVYGGSDDDRRTFYSALRLSGLMPSVISDVDGAYTFGGTTGSVGPQGRMLSDFSLWDTYRTTHSLLAVLDPPTARDSVNSLLTMAERGRGPPLWPQGTGEASVMLGSPGEIVVADAVLRAVPGLDATRAWNALRGPALDDALAPMARGPRGDSPTYRQKGFVPVTESRRSVALTVEYAHADHALANLATFLGQTDLAATLRARSFGWRSLFDPATRVLRAHTAEGRLVNTPYDPESWDSYAEANARQTSFMPWWDLAGFEQNLGSREALVTELSAFFDPAPEEEATALKNSAFELRYLPRQFFWASNEPDIQAPFMFALAGRHDLTARWSAWVRTTFYSAKPEGLPGNDDGGTLGSWYVCAALGLYPVAGTNRWVIGSPLFPRVDLEVAGGVFSIEAVGVSAESIYVQSATLNGAPFNQVELTQSQLTAGGRLTLEMGPTPSAWPGR